MAADGDVPVRPRWVRLDEEIEDEEGLTDSRERRVKRAEIRILKFTSIRERQIERIQTRIDSGEISPERRLELEGRIERERTQTEQYRTLARRTQGTPKPLDRRAPGIGEVTNLTNEAIV